MSLARCPVRHAARQRGFSTTLKRLYAEESSSPAQTAAAPANEEAAASAPPKRTMSKNVLAHSHRKAFVSWMSSEGHRYAVASTEGKNYLDGREYPFPLNPQFRPRVPTSEKMREDIHYDWTCGDGLQKLSNKYKLSLQRIEAILKLQDVKARWNKDGVRTMSSYSEGMNLMLGVADPFAFTGEQMTDVTMDPGRQIFALIPEAAEYTPTDAARDLGRIPFSKRGQQQRMEFLRKSKYEHESAFAEMTKGEVKDASNTPVETSATPVPDKRWTYTFKDSSSSSTLQRKLDGSLISREKRQKPSTSDKWIV